MESRESLMARLQILNDQIVDLSWKSAAVYETILDRLYDEKKEIEEQLAKTENTNS